MGEGMRPGTLQIKDTSLRYLAAIWRHDPERPDLGDGGPVLKERLVFTIRKSLLSDPTLLYGGDQETGAIIIYIEARSAFVVESAGKETPDHLDWQFEARRAPGSDPS
jgi:hypothetical protein